LQIAGSECPTGNIPFYHIVLVLQIAGSVCPTGNVPLYRVAVLVLEMDGALPS